MKWILVLLLSILSLGCSHSPGYYRSPPDTCNGAPGCAVPAIIDGLLHSEPAAKKCSEMRGDQRAKCNAQVDAIKRSIKQSQKN